jgi:hypothetical protein
MVDLDLQRVLDRAGGVEPGAIALVADADILDPLALEIEIGMDILEVDAQHGGGHAIAGTGLALDVDAGCAGGAGSQR